MRPDWERTFHGSPHAGMMHGDPGARVIKAESPRIADDLRWWGPAFVGPDESVHAWPDGTSHG